MAKTLDRLSALFGVLLFVVVSAAWGQSPPSQIGREVAIPVHLQDGEEFTISIPQLIQYGAQLFSAKFTAQEGAGRPKSKGTGAPISDPSSPLVFPRNFDRLSSPDANSCAGCHNAPIPGAGGDRVTEVFVLAQRFDHLTFDHADGIMMRGAVDESGKFVTLDNATNDRKTIGMNGSGFVEMLARQMTADLQAERDAIPLGGSKELTSKGVRFGTLIHNGDGTWDVTQVQGLAAPSLGSNSSKPSLIIRPLHQVGNVISIRQFSNNAFNHHHGMQSEERFGLGVDADGDGVIDELTVADLTAASMFQATMAVPGRVIPNDPDVERANLLGEAVFNNIGCASCHATLPLTANNNPGLPGKPGWIYFEPNPYNPGTASGSPNLQLGPTNYPVSAPALTVDLTSAILPLPRLRVHDGVVMVEAYTDLKLHDMHDIRLDLAKDPECEPLDQNQPAGTPGFFAGNCKFITRKLWGFYNQGGAFMHHGKFTTAREAVEAHNGEALSSRQAFDALASAQQGALIEFLKSLQVLPPGSKSLVVDEHGNPKRWPPSEDSSADER